MKVTRELIGSTDEIIAASFLPNAGDAKAPSAALAVATNSPLPRVFDPDTMACTAALAGHAGAILTLDTAVGPSGEALVLTGSRDHTVRLWDLSPAAEPGAGVGGGAAFGSLRRKLSASVCCSSSAAAAVRYKRILAR